MNLNRRLFRLECQPVRRRPVSRPDDGLTSDDAMKAKALQRLLRLPLPPESTEEEYQKALELFIALRNVVRAGQADEHSHWPLRLFSERLHEKYGIPWRPSR